MKIKKNWGVLAGCFSLCIITCLIQPHGDDFLYLNYFDNIKNWGCGGYSWVNDNILLPRGYWRPWEDLLGSFNARMPGTFPYINHIIITLIHVVCGYLVYKLSLLLNINKKASFVGALFFLFTTTAMGGLLSVDSIAQVLVTLFGLSSVYCFCIRIHHSKLLWLLFSVAAMFSKESGFVWIFVGPLFNVLISQIEENKIAKNLKKKGPFIVKYIVIGTIPVILYFICFYMMKPELFTNLSSEKGKDTTEIVNGVVEKPAADWTSIEKSTSDTNISMHNIVKSSFVLYGASLIPIDTSAVYYKSFFLIVLTSFLSIIGLFFVVKAIINGFSKDASLMIGLMILLIWTSSVSLITRAGEISPHPSNAFMAIIIAHSVNQLKWNRLLVLSSVCFCISTLITDLHKYYLCYTAGKICMEMGEETVRKTNGFPEKVLCITVTNDMKDGTFIINKENDYYNGGPAIMQYNYKYPLIKDVISINYKETFISEKIDSIVNSVKGMDYDCIWIQKGGHVDVINLK